MNGKLYFLIKMQDACNEGVDRCCAEIKEILAKNKREKGLSSDLVEAVQVCKRTKFWQQVEETRVLEGICATIALSHLTISSATSPAIDGCLSCLVLPLTNHPQLSNSALPTACFEILLQLKHSKGPQNLATTSSSQRLVPLL